jgi:L-aminopeptidase/D-esterase-like protein
MTTISNENATLTIQTEFDGPTLAFDIPGVSVGIAEYPEGPTGCTVIRFDEIAMTAVDVRGGWAGTTQPYEYCDAICLCAGSLLGLEAVSGVMAAIFAARNYDFKNTGNPVVNGAVVYDYDRRDNAIHPDMALGRAAWTSAKPGVFPLGSRGAGRSTTAGKFYGSAGSEYSGQGGAFAAVEDVRIAVFTVVNPMGALVDRGGKVVRGNLDPVSGERRHYSEDVRQRLNDSTLPSTPGQNTTLTVIVTNQKLEPYWLAQLGKQVHTSMARAIHPFHTVWDGDTLFTVSTGQVKGINATSLGIIASELAWDAVLAAAQNAR